MPVVFYRMRYVFVCPGMDSWFFQGEWTPAPLVNNLNGKVKECNSKKYIISNKICPLEEAKESDMIKKDRLPGFQSTGIDESFKFMKMELV